MKFINSSIEYVEQLPGLIGVFKHIEKAARNCYKSEDKIDETSYERIMKTLEERGHLSPYEHGTIYLKDTYDVSAIGSWQNCIASKYEDNPFSRVNFDHNMDFRGVYITTNYRVIVENGWFDDLKYICLPTKYHEKRYTFKVDCSIGVSREWNRNRGFAGSTAISEQSTRYCNYSKDKFGSEITFVIPQWTYEKDIASVNIWKNSCSNTEESYMTLINNGLKPQEARSVLSLDTATCVYYTAYKSDWEHFIELRTSLAAHPDIRVLANLIKDYIIELDGA